MEENSPQGIWDQIADEMLLKFAESGHPIFRATTPLSRGILKSKGHGKLSIDFTADYSTIETIFRIIVSANQLSLYGAVANMCEEFETHHDGSGEPEILMGQSIFQERMDHHNQEDGFREARELDLYWKSRPVFSTSNMELKSELSP